MCVQQGGEREWGRGGKEGASRGCKWVRIEEGHNSTATGSRSNLKKMPARPLAPQPGTTTRSCSVTEYWLLMRGRGWPRAWNDVGTTCRHVGKEGGGAVFRHVNKDGERTRKRKRTRE